MKQLQDFRNQGWPVALNARPEIMSRNEQAMLTEIGGDNWQILKHYANDGFYDDGCGRNWVSQDGQSYAKRRLRNMEKHDKHLSTLPRLPDNDELKKRIGD